MAKKKTSQNPLHAGVVYDYPWAIRRTSNGKECRDRLPWGGITSTRCCSCKGRCQYDEEHAE